MIYGKNTKRKSMRSIWIYNTFNISLFLILSGCTLFQKAKWTPPEFYGIECDRFLDLEQKTFVQNWKTGLYWKIYFRPSAPQTCPSPHFPYLALINNEADAYIQIVRSSLPKNVHQPFPYHYIDAPEDHIKNGHPFHQYGSKFYSNDSWSQSDELMQKLGLKAHEWYAQVFAVKIQGHVLIPVGGLEWGYRRHYQSETTTSLPLKSLTLKDWEAQLPLLRERFPRYHYIEDTTYF